MLTQYKEGGYMAKSEKVKEITFTKENILKFKQYRNRVDLLSVLLEDNKAYSKSEVEALIEKFMKGKVK